MEAPGLTRAEPLVEPRPARLAWLLTPRPADPLTRWLLLATFVTTGVGVLLMVALHLQQGFGGVDPINGMLSDYPLQPGGWLFNVGLVVISAGSLPLWLALARYRVVHGTLASLAMGAWCLGLVGIALFTKDAANAELTTTGDVHLYFTGVTCGAMPFLCLFVGWRHRRHHAWSRHARAAFWLALANIPCVLPFLIAFALNRITGTEAFSGPATGLIERVMGMLDLIALVVLALWATHAARTHMHPRGDLPARVASVRSCD